MSSPNFDPYQQGWQAHQYQPTQPSPTQPVYHYPQYNQPGHMQYALAPGSYAQPYYSSPASAPIIAELPAPLPPALPTTTSEEQLKQDELFARKMSQLSVRDPRTSIDPFSVSPQRSMPALHQHRSAQSLRPHSQSVSSSNDQPLNGMTHRHSISTVTHQRSAQSLRPHSKSFGTYAAPWTPASPGHAQKMDFTRFSTLPEVVVEPVPTPYSGPIFAEQSLPIPVVLDQLPTSRPSVAMDCSSLSLYVERHRQAPYPSQWSPPPVCQTLYAGRTSKHSSSSCWLDTPASSTWSEKRASDEAQGSVPAAFSFKFKSISGGFRSPRLSWTMTCTEQPKDPETKASKKQTDPWIYELKMDSRTNLRKSETLTPGKSNSKNILTTYVHALNYDTLRFVGIDQRAYMWVTSNKVSLLDGSRHDTLRHALFVATGSNPDPLYGHIVADHCFWDGGVDETGANLPDEAIYIRSPEVDPALVVATLQILKDWEKQTLKVERKRKPEAFAATEEQARKHPLGAAYYWKA
jgi:hypothetical protein